MSGAVTACDEKELRSLFLFEKLNDEQLARLCREGRVETFEPGWVCREGDPATCFYTLLEGTLVFYRRVDGVEVEVTRTDHRGAYFGALQAYTDDPKRACYSGSVQVVGPARFFLLSAQSFSSLMKDWFPMAVHLLEGLLHGDRHIQEAVRERERLLGLGALSAGLTHEINNPATAAVRASATLRERLAGMGQALGSLGGPDPQATLRTLAEIRRRVSLKLADGPPALDPLEASDREDAFTDWLEEHGVEDSWRAASAFAQAGLDTGWLDEIADVTDARCLTDAVAWLNHTVDAELLVGEIEEAANRISRLVDAAKQYTRLDRAPYEVTDVHALLDSTLLVLSAKIGAGVQVVKKYDRTLPGVPGYPGELNQVWTNLIDNAVSAMAGKGTLTVRTARDMDHVLVEFQDTGPGIPADVLPRIYEPFFTTKPVGEGTGLGLDISWRIVVNKHRGSLRVQSVPGDTRFQVRLPAAPHPASASEEDPR
ncbi:ATP-binding protein [Streptomyces albogriseolus]|uniref:ATP-binding protein n=1 Tax=Streptomyces albogriseolus TaxID=1887 RepID=UPI00367663B7